MKTSSGLGFGGSQSKVVLDNDIDVDSQHGSDENQLALDMVGVDKDKGIDGGKAFDNGMATDNQHGSEKSTAVVAVAVSSIPIRLPAAEIDVKAILNTLMLLDSSGLKKSNDGADQIKMLISEAKALKGLPDGKFCSFLNFRKLPHEIRRMIWDKAASEFKQDVFIQAYMVARHNEHARLTLNFRCLNKRETLPEVSREARSEVLRFRNVKIGSQLPGIKGVIYMNGESGMLVLRHDSTDRSNECVLEGVKNVVMDRGTGALEEPEFAHYLRKMFPDLQCFYIRSNDGHHSWRLEFYINDPEKYELVPKDVVFTSLFPNPTTWPQTWASAENIYNLESKPCPQVKMMSVFKRAGN